MLFMKMAQARENRKDNKGFSLVELIIVIAIMVALVAMLAPQFVKYVQRSRDAVVSSAAEDVLATAKSEFALTHLTFGEGTEHKIVIQVNNSSKTLEVKLTGLNYNEAPDGTLRDEAGFQSQCGIDTQKKTQSTVQYTIVVADNGGSPTFTMSKTHS